MTELQAVDILLVEDNPQDADLTIHALRKRHLANHVEDCAETLVFVFCRGAYAGRERCQPPKVILLDLKLPKVEGLEVLATSRRTRAPAASRW